MSSTPLGLPPPQPGQPCSCGSGKPFESCCGPLLAGARKPDTAEELMRSRFTAHVAGDFAYLHRTYLPTARVPYKEEKTGIAPPAWSRLVIHRHEPGRNPDHAYVEFSAYYRDENGEYPMEERSEFVREDGQWLFARTVRSGPAPIRSTTPKVGRNDPCPCGSGKKYKHCCLTANRS